MFCAIFFIKIARSYLFTSALCFPLFLSLLPSILAFASFYSCLCFLLSSLLLPSIPASASIYPRPEPELLLDTPDLPVAVLFPTTFPYRDTPFSP